MSEAESERKFLHDLSNPLSIAYGNIKLITGKLEKDIHSMDVPGILDRLQKAVRNFERANALLDERRTFLRGLKPPTAPG